MALNLVDQLVHTTVRIECHTATGAKTSGTGFICQFGARDGKHVPAIVTNKHVIEGAIVGIFHMTIANDQGEPNYGEHVMVPVQDFEARCVKHSNIEVDLAVLPLAPVLKWMTKQGKSAFYRALNRDLWADANFMNELSAVEDILMIGYPNGLWDRKNNLPIARRGITATPPYIDFEGKPQFMIDCACFPGSSGSPIYLFNMGAYPEKSGNLAVGTRLKLLGVLWGGPQYTAEGEIKVVPVPTAIQPIALSKIPINLGYCIKADQLIEFDNHFDKLLAADQKAEETQESGAA